MAHIYAGCSPGAVAAWKKYVQMIERIPERADEIRQVREKIAALQKQP